MYYDYQHGNHSDSIFRENQNLIQDINKAINNEFSAIHYYTRLAELAPNEQFRQGVLDVRQDEIRHFSRFSRSFLELTGHFPNISLKVDLPESFKKGIQHSIKDEKGTVPFYKEIASKITNPQIQNRFLRAAADEQRHYELFSNMKSYL